MEDLTLNDYFTSPTYILNEIYCHVKNKQKTWYNSVILQFVIKKSFDKKFYMKKAKELSHNKLTENSFELNELKFSRTYGIFIIHWGLKCLQFRHKRTFKNPSSQIFFYSESSNLFYLIPRGIYQPG